MSDPEETPPAAPGQPIDPAVVRAAVEGERERIWDSPIGIGEPVEFDPTLHQPGLSPEEIEKLLGEASK